MPQIPSYKDIATKAGVSQMSVSLALRGSPGISTATRNRILRIAQKIGYTRDPQVAEIMTYLRHRRGKKHNPLIAYINVWPDRTPLTHGSYFRLFFEGASTRATQLGYRLEEFWLREPGMHGARLSNIFYVRGVQGAVLPSMPPDLEDFKFDWSGLSGVALSLNACALGLNHVCNNHLNSIELTLDKLQNCNYRRIGLVLNHDFDERSRHQWAGYFYWAQSRLPAAQRVPLLMQSKDNPAEFKRWLRASRPDVVVSPCASVLNWIKEAGYRVPERVGFCGLGLHAGHGTEVAGIDHRPALVGAAAIDQLTSQMARHELGLPKDRRELMIDGIWRPGTTLRNSKV